MNIEPPRTMMIAQYLILHCTGTHTQLFVSFYHLNSYCQSDIFQAMLDVSADEGWLVTSLRITQLIQMIVQGRWYHDNALLTLPHMTPFLISCLRYFIIKTIT